MGKQGLLIYTKGGLEKTGRGHPLGKEGLLVKKQGSGKIGWGTPLGKQGLLIYTKGVWKKQERDTLWGKKACL